GQFRDGNLGPRVGPQHAGVPGETPALTQVGEHGALVGPKLELAAQLRQGDHRALELAGQDLEATAHLGHLDLAVLGVAPARHQLEVVDHDHAQVADLAAQPAGLGADLHDRQVGVVVDPDRGGRQSADRLADAAPVVLAEL